VTFYSVFPHRIHDNSKENNNYEANVRLPENNLATAARCSSSSNGCSFIHDLLTTRAVTYIQERTSQQNPFFLFLSYTTPHVGSWKPEKEGSRLSFAERVRKIAPDAVCPNSMWVPTGALRIDACRHKAAITNYLDRDIGTILDTLEENGLSESTVILFAADNGPNGNININVNKQRRKVHDLRTFNSTSGQRGGKRTLFEGGLRTPFIVQWKGHIKPGSVSESLVSLVDLFATFADLAQADIDRSKVDSLSLVPVFKGLETELEREYLHFEYCDQQSLRWNDIKKNPSSLCSWAIVKKDGYKLQYNHKEKRTYLFNLRTDPSEKNSLHRPQRIVNMRALYQSSHFPLEEVGYHGQTVKG